VGVGSVGGKKRKGRTTGGVACFQGAGGLIEKKDRGRGSVGVGGGWESQNLKSNE